MSAAYDNHWRKRCTSGFLLVTGIDKPIDHSIECLEIQLDNTFWMQATPTERIAKRQRKTMEKDYSKGMLKAEEQDKKNISFFQDHRRKIIRKIAELKEILQLKPELDRQKLVAFAMGHHKRLGGSLLMANLDPEVLRMIMEQV
jgi:hypothetical protein